MGIESSGLPGDEDDGAVGAGRGDRAGCDHGSVSRQVQRAAAAKGCGGELTVAAVAECSGELGCVGRWGG